MRSHPPTLLTLARRALRGPCGLTARSRVMVAVSGGPDSIALLHVCCILHERGIVGQVTAHGVDHGLRPEAAGELRIAEELARAHCVPFAVTTVSVAPGSNLQARARTARWDALARAKAEAGADVIATGHHQDDRAETVLIRILRGAPLPALGVLPARDGDRVRPFIAASRADIRAHIQRHGLAFAEDPSNRSTRFLRVRVRCEVLPLLEQLSPRIREHLAELADAVLASRERPGDQARATLHQHEVDPRLESKRAMAALARLRTGSERGGAKNALARVSLKGGVVLSVGGAQALGEAGKACSATKSSTKKNGSEP